MAAHQAPLSLGFSRQEHWSGLPFPSPMHESENESEVAQLCLTLSDPMDCSLPGSSAHGIFQARVLEWGATAFSILHCRQMLYPLSHQGSTARPMTNGLSKRMGWGGRKKWTCEVPGHNFSFLKVCLKSTLVHFLELHGEKQMEFAHKLIQKEIHTQIW